MYTHEYLRKVYSTGGNGFIHWLSQILYHCWKGEWRTKGVQQSALSVYTNGNTVHTDEMFTAATSYNNNSKHCLLFLCGIKNCLKFQSTTDWFFCVKHVFKFLTLVTFNPYHHKPMKYVPLLSLFLEAEWAHTVFVLIKTFHLTSSQQKTSISKAEFWYILNVRFKSLAKKHGFKSEEVLKELLSKVVLFFPSLTSFETCSNRIKLLTAGSL